MKAVAKAAIAASVALATLAVLSAYPLHHGAKNGAVPRTSKVAFIRNGDIWIANSDGTGQRRIVRDGYSPCWSPDRQRIAFTRASNVWIANADGSGQKQWTTRWKATDEDRVYHQDHVTIQRDMDISWDPRGRTITFSHFDQFHVVRIGRKEGEDIYTGTIFDVA